MILRKSVMLSAIWESRFRNCVSASPMISKPRSTDQRNCLLAIYVSRDCVFVIAAISFAASRMSSRSLRDSGGIEKFAVLRGNLMEEGICDAIQLHQID